MKDCQGKDSRPFWTGKRLTVIFCFDMALEKSSFDAQEKMIGRR
jgi:hypothetical protein